ncbi:50S ribosomal protein L13 [bacterium]|nr:50S ribosomal protein L13 [bacterium]
MRTYLPKEEEIERKWYLIDAQGQTLGRLATFIARLLIGKHKPIYAPNVDVGDRVIVINAEKIKVTGKKLDKKSYHWHTGYLGGLKSKSLRKMLEEEPEKVLYLAVKGMLPKNRLRDKRLRGLRIYRGSEHPHAAQNPQPINLAGGI